MIALEVHILESNYLELANKKFKYKHLNINFDIINLY